MSYDAAIQIFSHKMDQSDEWADIASCCLKVMLYKILGGDFLWSLTY